MSNKKRRISLRLTNEEAAVVAPLAFWDRLEEWMYESAEEFPEQADGWIAAATHISEWVAGTMQEDSDVD